MLMREERKARKIAKRQKRHEQKSINETFDRDGQENRPR